MKSIVYTLRSLSVLSLLLSLLVLSTSCEQQNYEPNYNAAPGGGTVSTYKAYTLSSATGTTIYGRVVFYKYSATVTLVEIGLYNTANSATYSSSIYQGKAATGSATALKPLDTISGTTGEFATNKYFTISDASFYANLDKYDANVKVMSGATLIASGNIGANATPVAQQ
ncbi:hypothetical protein [Spirosoma validum]|uniref:CHRD domain-containing protein n=1 Tax=Spirosoma validum TaxID=2771355 RepID=A0A927AZK2_9BACT|nr:hypothetical protein [Spirosoma validum]MBD2752764.1 hypothetical protein [Spirosoma validum]